ncbi:IS110 family transposase [Mesorhizobium sp. M1409]|uniref:IS110 family transposase n=1 Tax=unclassified Mesorhizobium TaxID=325217 RepID=UPI0033388C45
MIAHAKVKTDTIDATVLAKLYASGFLPEVWVPDPGTLALRRQVTRRTQLVRQRSRLKNLIQSILHAHLIPPCPHGNLVGISGRKWLTRQILPADERAAIERHLGLINQINEALTVVEADIAVHALQDPTIRRLMTLPGLDVTVAASVAAAIGDIRRFSDPQKLVAYLGLNPSVRQSGEGPAYHGRITKQGRGHARGMLVEAAWAASRLPQADRLAPREAHRGRRHCAQACNDHLAHAEQGYRLHLGPAGLARPQVQIGRAACRPSDQPCQTRHRPRLQHPGQARRRTIPRREGEAAYSAATSRWRTRPERQKAVEKAAE